MEGYISIKEILDNILDHPKMQKLSLERAINYAVRFIRIVGMPNVFIDKYATIDINNYRGVLPCDFNSITQVRLQDDKHKNLFFRATTDTFHTHSDEDKHDLTYKIQGGVIFTSIKEGTVEIMYKAIPIDDDGFPLIVDDSSFIRALELFIKKEYFTILFDTKKINRFILQNVQQEYAWAVGQAQSSLIKLSLDQMQSFTNMMNTLVVRTKEHKQGFKTLGKEEHIRIH